MNDKKRKNTGKGQMKDEGEAMPANGDTLNEDTINSKAELKNFLVMIKDRLVNQSAPPLHALSALQHTFNLPGINEHLDKANKELAREIWQRLKQAGIQIKNPPLLFGGEESA